MPFSNPWRVGPGTSSPFGESLGSQHGPVQASLINEHKYLLDVTEEQEWPLPADPVLRMAAIAVRDLRLLATIYDAKWEVVYVTEAQRRNWGHGHMTPVGVTRVTLFDLFDGAAEFNEVNRQYVLERAGMVLADLPGGRDELRERLHPSLVEFVDEIDPIDDEVRSFRFGAPAMDAINEAARMESMNVRLRDRSGRLAGVMSILKPAGDGYMQAQSQILLDEQNVARVQQASVPARRPAAILSSDLDGSTDLARRLSTATYFELARLLVLESDRCVVDAGGLVGRHVGDGVTAFFLAENFGSESAAARACITAARLIREGCTRVADGIGRDGNDLTVRFGLHWGATLYVGAIATKARFEVTAMGDQVNETARIEACATGGLTLASKDLVERLSEEDAQALALDPSHLTYVQLADLATATEKARRDAPSIPVCEISAAAYGRP